MDSFIKIPKTDFDSCQIIGWVRGWKQQYSYKRKYADTYCSKYYPDKIKTFQNEIPKDKIIIRGENGEIKFCLKNA